MICRNKLQVLPPGRATFTAVPSSTPNPPQSGAVRRRPGGRNAQVRRQVLTAVTSLLAEDGMHAITFERVAKRAHVNRATLYRRWTSVVELTSEAVGETLRQAIPMPDTGTLRGDLRQILDAAHAFLTSTEGMASVRVSLAAAGGSDLHEVRQDVWTSRFALQLEVAERGIARGEIDAGTDLRVMLEIVAAPLYFRLFIVGAGVDSDYLDRVVDFALRGAGPHSSEIHKTPIGEK